MDRAFWKGRRVLLTGHTGFKGAWAALWLTRMGARVTGLSLPPEGTPNLWSLLALDDVNDIAGDIRTVAAIARAVAAADPEVVLHLAAQSLVRRSYRQPVETFDTNVMGTVRLLQALRNAPALRAVVVVTSDKCYRNVEQIWGYREMDPMGGHDPYSASKGAAEIVTAAMRDSFFAEPGAARIATARAGNVIGGGDWSEDRLIPDIVRGCLGAAGQVVIRAPGAVRPWQHVLEPLRGYLMLAEALAGGREDAAAGWNFGPDRGDERAVLAVAERLVAALGRGRIVVDKAAAAGLHEAHLLQLDSTKARGLGWAPVLSLEEGVAMTADWYGKWAAGADARQLTLEQIEYFEAAIGRT